MDEATSSHYAELEGALAEAQAELDAVLEKNAALVAADAADDQPSPSKNDKRSVLQQVMDAESKVAVIREGMRKIEWEEAGIEEGPAQVIGIDNVVGRA